MGRSLHDTMSEARFLQRSQQHANSAGMDVAVTYPPLTIGLVVLDNRKPSTDVSVVKFAKQAASTL